MTSFTTKYMAIYGINEATEASPDKIMEETIKGFLVAASSINLAIPVLGLAAEDFF